MPPGWIEAREQLMATKTSNAKSRSAPDSVRERILGTARDLIYAEGARAVGVDRIVAESGVAKMSLYRWFPSKDELIVAVLNEERERILKAWDENMARTPGEPLKQLRAQFSSLAAAIQRPSYRGCIFLNAAMAFADPEHPARAVVMDFKAEIVRRFTALATATGARHPKVFAEQLCLLIDGAHASGQALGKEGHSAQLQATVEVLIAAHVPGASEPRIR
jgi:AcrR family transcriptional regulator